MSQDGPTSTMTGQTALRQTMRLDTRADALAAARTLAPAIRDRAVETEALRQAHPESIAALLASGLFGLTVPKRFGGSELGMAAVLDATVEISQACGSTGWVFGVISGHQWLTSLFPAQAQEEVFSDPRSLVSIVIRFGASSNPDRVEGGYLWRNGRGRFCSGIDHANWVLLGGAVALPSGEMENRYFLVPKSDVQIEDDWFTVGLRGTGSKSIRIDEAFIPEHRTVLLSDLQNGTSPGAALHDNALYRLSMNAAMPLTIAAPSVGIARAGLDMAVQNADRRLTGLEPEQIAEQSPVLAGLAGVSADIDAAYTLLEHDAVLLDSTPGTAALPALDQARFSRNRAYAVQQCRHAVNRLFESSGGSGIYESNPIQRIWRDSNAAAAHAGFNWDAASTSFGRSLLDLPPSRFARAGRAK